MNLSELYGSSNGQNAVEDLLRFLRVMEDLTRCCPKYARYEITTFALFGRYTGTFYGIEKVWKLEWRD
ncbi:MAG: hypothetical protein QW540_09740 [Archaeoglobaceae archaeon]